MNDLGNSVPQPANEKDTIPFDNGPAETPSPANKPANGAPSISRAPLNLGGGSAPAPAAAPKPAGAPTARPPAPRPAPVRVAAAGNGASRITGCKTFFTKLHPGAIEFLDDQINQWLKDNPAVVIQHTNTTTGEVQAKKTEANILITVWYYGQAAKTTPHMG
jgi:hypothetical protein